MILLYKGRRGAGKTLTMVKDGYRFYLNGYRVLRNFKAKFGEYISNEEVLKLDKKSNVKDCVLMIDEVQIFFDSRRSMSKGNLKFSNFVQQTRKRNIHLLITTQYSNTIDLRLRQHLDFIAFPKFVKDYNVCEVIYEDISAFEDEMLMDDRIGTCKIIYDAEPVFKLYNHREMIV